MPNTSTKLEEEKCYKSESNFLSKSLFIKIKLSIFKKNKKGDELFPQNISDLRFWTRYYFLAVYKPPKGHSIAKLNFEDKKICHQLGQCMVIQYNIENTNKVSSILFHLKTHERGVLSRRNKHARLFDPRELLVYIYLELIGLGPSERHYYYNLDSKQYVYIASKDINESLINQSWRTFYFDSKDIKFINSFKPDSNYMKCLIYMELIINILYLNDVNNNLGNFGLVRPVLSYKDIRIIDFFISSDFLKDDMLKRFELPDIRLTHKSHFDEINYLFTIKTEEKISKAKCILSDILNCDKDFFKRNFNAAIEKTNSFMHKYGEGLKDDFKKEFDKNLIDYQDYIEKVNLNFEKFIEKYVK